MNTTARWWLAGLLALSYLQARAAIPAGYVTVAQVEKVPADILYAIACAESGRPMPDGRVQPWPWVLNVAGDAEYFASRLEAYRALTDVLSQTASVDVGLGQINWHWHGARFLNAWQALDPYANLHLTARLLREQFERCACQDWWFAVERYHAPSDTEKAPERRAHYRRNVERCYAAHEITE
jgi:hypothetical protein